MCVGVCRCVCVCACVGVCMYVCVCVCTNREEECKWGDNIERGGRSERVSVELCQQHVCVSDHIHIYTCVCVCSCVCSCVRVCMCSCVCRRVSTPQHTHL